MGNLRPIDHGTRAPYGAALWPIPGRRSGSWAVGDRCCSRWSMAYSSCSSASPPAAWSRWPARTSRAPRSQAVVGRDHSLVELFVAGQLEADDLTDGGPSATRAAELATQLALLTERDAILRIEVRGTNGRVLFSDDAALAGEQAPLSSAMADALAGRPSAALLETAAGRPTRRRIPPRVQRGPGVPADRGCRWRAGRRGRHVARCSAAAGRYRRRAPRHHDRDPGCRRAAGRRSCSSSSATAQARISTNSGSCWRRPGAIR